MPQDNGNEEITLTIILGTFLVLFFAIVILFLFYMFNKKNQLYKKEKELMRNNFEKAMLESQLEIQEQLFRSISNDIHDNVGQMLSLVKVQLNIMEQSQQPNPVLMRDISENVSQVMQELRDIAQSMNDQKMLDNGLPEAVNKLLQRINRTGKIKAWIEVNGLERHVGVKQTKIFYRIIQESVQNVLKHAEATEIIIQINFDQDCMKICIKDNGKGFDPGLQQKQITGMGLRSMRDRAELAGASFQINSGMEGTTIVLILPYA